MQQASTSGRSPSAPDAVSEKIRVNPRRSVLGLEPEILAAGTNPGVANKDHGLPASRRASVSSSTRVRKSMLGIWGLLVSRRPRSRRQPQP